ncbi:MAG: TonB-dependent receptor [Bacteroidales bacterium]|nr:TonB-dependent receptor [Candidatus Liminaster caballi]
MLRPFSFLSLLFISSAAIAQTDTASVRTEIIEEVSVTGGVKTRRMAGAVNGLRIGQEELFRAACCNLGESFTTNPSVDVSYSDAATGAKQIRLLGLSGTYVQMLAETLPVFRGAAQPFALGYVPGTWMKAINVSKGAASVKNGYESLTGQIDIDYLKTDDEPSAHVNIFADQMQRIQVDADINRQLTSSLSTALLVHYGMGQEDSDHNGDGFIDSPKQRQYNISSRWKLRLPRYIMHAGASAIVDSRRSGQYGSNITDPYRTGISAHHYEGYMKHAFIIDPSHNSNIALMANAAMHLSDNVYGRSDWRSYDVNQKNVYAQLMYESDLTDRHSISTGVSFSHDYLSQHVRIKPLSPRQELDESENVFGAYAQYTYTLGTKLTLMAGIRGDHSDMHGTFVTPRAHVKLSPAQWLSIRLSAGKGYRTVHALAENNNLLASGRTFEVGKLSQEEAWNYGGSLAFIIPLGERSLKLNTDYYYTHFIQQAVIDYDSDPTAISIHNLHGRSFSHVWQVDATCEVVDGLELTAAYRRNDVRCTYGESLLSKPLTNRYKALFCVGYKTPLELWQADVTLQLNGGGRLPGGMGSFHSYPQLSAQLTRRFRYIDISVGGENLTGYRQHMPIIDAAHPWSPSFEPTLIYGPIEGAMGYVQLRIKI